jgi:putative oxidoreductase
MSTTSVPNAETRRRIEDGGQLALRLAIAASFALAVADRFGVLGGPGEDGVSWGSWTIFRAYTAQLVPVPVDLVVDTAAVLATALALLLAVGLWTRLAAGVAALLTVTFGVTMLVFLGPLAPFRYPVFVFTAAAILLAGLKRYRWSIDALRKEVPGAGRDNDAPGTR